MDEKVQKTEQLLRRANLLKARQRKLTRGVVRVVGLLDRLLARGHAGHDRPLNRDEILLRNKLEEVHNELSDDAQFQARLEEVDAMQRSREWPDAANVRVARMLQGQEAFLESVYEHLIRHQDAIDAMKKIIRKSQNHLQLMEKSLADMRAARERTHHHRVDEVY